MPVLSSRWHQPLRDSWVWLPSPEDRHAAFARLGAGATLPALAEALEHHDPGLRAAAKSICREAGVRWRDTLWHVAVAYAVAFSTQAFERHRHRKPVHVVHSTGDGLSQINDPFGVRGEPMNIEGGLEAILEQLLFPLLLGHGLLDEPREPARIYGATAEDSRAPRRRTDAHVSHDTDRAAQVAVILGMVPGYKSATRIWDGPAGTMTEADALRSAAPSSDLVAELRQEMRLLLAGFLYDAHGSLQATADDAWQRLGW